MDDADVDEWDDWAFTLLRSKHDRIIGRLQATSPDNNQKHKFWRYLDTVPDDVDYIDEWCNEQLEERGVLPSQEHQQAEQKATQSISALEELSVTTQNTSPPQVQQDRQEHSIPRSLINQEHHGSQGFLSIPAPTDFGDSITFCSPVEFKVSHERTR
ncbi:hypothetical protein BJ508DRAFT_332950 [Ascobolus immersus RN42]|uniref:Uncharacterized protein n=1 Tax=Ascobolus immersus RN42 TaxID=1160509 RepID=A0A3N4HXY5_ASCIM|nr:hypothetical protein BJ508DRAFT_332950 [Ascobolus immersus RN42]